jgi:hypothetical protein
MTTATTPPHLDQRCATGLEGLDEVLAEGLPSNCLYLIQGNPGSGKTTLALQFLPLRNQRGAAQSRPLPWVVAGRHSAVRVVGHRIARACGRPHHRVSPFRNGAHESDRSAARGNPETAASTDRIRFPLHVVDQGGGR